MTIRVVLVSEHPILLGGLERALGSEEGFEVAASCSQRDQTLEAVRLHRPDVLLLDAGLSVSEGLRVLRAMQAAGIEAKVVLLADDFSEQELLSALTLGAKGILLKEMAAPLVRICLRKVNAGEPWVERNTYGRALDGIVRRERLANEAEEGAEALTARELAIVLHAVEGKPNKEIAKELGIRTSTVKNHLHHVFSKLHVDGRAGLAQYARRKGLL